MATALSLKREHTLVLQCDKDAQKDDSSHVCTQWHYRRLTAQEAWDLRDDTFSAKFVDGEQSMSFNTGARQKFVLTSTLLRVEDLGDPDKPGQSLVYPGPSSPLAERMAFFDRVPSEWLSEVADGIYEQSELADGQEGNFDASPALSLTTAGEAKKAASSQ